ncbi:MAG: NADH-quinone oxidoreductase subunit NuoH [Verrucomicrobia bacterium]|nr:NADH-quinone oxidoreductase subunit NuoH [Cytophagales bacterium]
MEYFLSAPFLITALIIFLIFAVTLLIATYSTLAERKFAGFFQDRLGPNRAGPFGLLQPIADAGKMFFKEEFIPAHASKWLFIAGPCLAMLTALMSSAVIPFGEMIMLDEKTGIPVQGIDVNIGILYVFGVVSLGVYGVMIGGWASNNKFSLLGALRAASQNISYELAMGMSIVAVLMMYGTLSLREMTIQQADFGTFLYQPLGFIIFLTCAFAECNRTPFDLPECETELVGGYHTEYSSMKLGLYLFSEYVNMFASSAVMATLYFGGYHYPFDELVKESMIGSWGTVLGQNLFTLTGTMAIFIKAFLGIFFFMWVRWTLPRFRYDQLMDLGWKGLIPLAIFNILLTGSGILVSESLNNKNLYFPVYYGGLVALIGIGLVIAAANYRRKLAKVAA